MGVSASDTKTVSGALTRNIAAPLLGAVYKEHQEKSQIARKRWTFTVNCR
jgi:hypothetical protein